MVAEHLEALAMSWPWKTASNRFLARRFAASMLPHVRDEVAFADVPARTAVRARLGLDDRLWLGFVGTVRRHKGVGAAIEAIAMSGRKDIGLLIAGAENAEATSLKQQASTAGVQVVLVPPFARSELREVLASIDAVILPSEESSATRGQVPAKLFDAMAAGIGVIASDLDSHREALGATGMLFPPGNVEALAAVIAELTTERAAAVGQEARARFLERYSYRSAVPQFGRLLDAVFQGN
jgi:glycosyltransferase involved in cell wall biosynthesis